MQFQKRLDHPKPIENESSKAADASVHMQLAKPQEQLHTQYS